MIRKISKRIVLALIGGMILLPFLCALITHESARTWDPEIISPAGAVGLMQILPSTASEGSEIR